VTLKKNTALRRMFGPRRNDVTGYWRNIHDEELHNLYSSPNIIRAMKSRRMRSVENTARGGGMINAYSILLPKPEGKRPLDRRRHR
jgi:hypothetical protein